MVFLFDVMRMGVTLGSRWDHGLYSFSSPCYQALSSVGPVEFPFNPCQACRRSQRTKARSLHLEPPLLKGIR